VKYTISKRGAATPSIVYYANVRFDNQINSYMTIARNRFVEATNESRTDTDFEDGVDAPASGANILTSGG
jgi:hypothetical protein